LALEVFEGLDARFLAGDDLDVVRVDGGDGGQPSQRRLETGVFHAVPDVVHRIADGERQFTATGLQQIEVFHRSLGSLHRRFGAVDTIAEQLGQGYADGVVHTAGAAGQNVEEGRCGECRGTRRKGNRSDQQAETFFHAHEMLRLLLWP